MKQRLLGIIYRASGSQSIMLILSFVSVSFFVTKTVQKGSFFMDPDS